MSDDTSSVSGTSDRLTVSVPPHANGNKLPPPLWYVSRRKDTSVLHVTQEENGYTPGMQRDLMDQTLEGVSATYPDLDVSAYQVTGRLARLGLYLARRQEEVFGRFGLNRGEVGVLSALRSAG